MSSSQLLFGNAVNLDRSLFLPPVERPAQGQPLSAHISKILKFQDEVMEKSRTILKESDSKQTATASTKIFTTFLPGTYVLAKYRNSFALYPAPTRLHTYWKGPLKVITNNLSEQESYHVTDLKPFIFDPLKIDLLDIARRDCLEFFIEEIIAISGNIKKLSTLDFHVKWLGYDDTFNVVRH
jgi:hypothetical protein